MSFGKVGKAGFQVGDGFGGQYLVDVPDGPLVDGKGLVSAGIFPPLDIMEQGAEQIQLRLLPEILTLVDIGSVFDNGFRNGLDEGVILLDTRQKVDAVAVFLIQKVESFHHRAMVSGILAGGFKKFSLGIDTD